MVKLPPRYRRRDSPFTQNEMIWIVRNAGKKKGVEIRREFILHFSITNKKAVPRADAFTRVVARFDETGGVSNLIREPILTARTPENIDAVRDYFEEDGRRSINLAVVDFDSTFLLGQSGGFFGRISNGCLSNSRKPKS